MSFRCSYVLAVSFFFEELSNQYNNLSNLFYPITVQILFFGESAAVFYINPGMFSLKLAF